MKKTASFILVLSLLLAFIIPAEGGWQQKAIYFSTRALNWEARRMVSLRRVYH